MLRKEETLTLRRVKIKNKESSYWMRKTGKRKAEKKHRSKAGRKAEKENKGGKNERNSEKTDNILREQVPAQRVPASSNAHLPPNLHCDS